MIDKMIYFSFDTCVANNNRDDQRDAHSKQSLFKSRHNIYSLFMELKPSYILTFNPLFCQGLAYGQKIQRTF